MTRSLLYIEKSCKFILFIRKRRQKKLCLYKLPRKGGVQVTDLARVELVLYYLIESCWVVYGYGIMEVGIEEKLFD